MNDKAIYLILSVADRTDGLSRGSMAKFFQGQTSRAIMKKGLDHFGEFGSLSGMSKSEILSHVDYLIERGCLQIGSLFFPMIQMTDIGIKRLARMPELAHKEADAPLPAKAIIDRTVDRLSELRNMPYKEYLQTAEWKKTARSAKARVKNRCQLCNCSGKLNVHHNNYQNIGNELDSDLIVLCEKCHAKHHDKLPQEN